MSAREPLTVRDLAYLTGIAAEAADPHALFAAADALVKRTIGHKLFTIMRVHILGNVLGAIFVYATSLISVSMILAAGLVYAWRKGALEWV